MTTTDRTGTAAINGTKLYYEIHGHGPPVLLISGATGDAGHFAKLVPFLAGNHTVITYDRRGNSRSPASAPTSLDQQADDAAALLRELHLAPATVFGTSGGAVIALRLALRRPEVATRVLVHEPPLIAALPHGDEMMHSMRGMLEQALAKGGPRGATEVFIRMNAGDDAFEHLDPALRERLLNNGPWLFSQELAMFTSWAPSQAELAELRVPVQVLGGNASGDAPPRQGAAWLAHALNQQIVEVPGAHTPYLTQPDELAAALEPLL